MKLIKFRVKNYKSIKDSGNCYLDSKITVLAGMNESGKTSILESLEDMSIKKQIRPEAVPIGILDNKPEICITIRLEENEIKTMCEYLKINKINTIKDAIITKKYPNEYDVDQDFIDAIQKDIQKEYDKRLNEVKEIYEDLKNKLQNFSIPDEKWNDLQQLSSVIKSYQIQYVANITSEDKSKSLASFEKLKGIAVELKNSPDRSYIIEKYIKDNFIPNFILFTSFSEILPHQKPIPEARNTEIIKDLATISDLNFDKLLANSDAGEREKHKATINFKIYEDYKMFWSQDETNIFVAVESNNIFFWIKENEELYKPEMRSKGKQWHLAFYIKIAARSDENKDNIILIDEPGLFLHAKAQKDILKQLEKCSKKKQIVFTTHSPYLIQSDKLNRIRLITKYKTEGTKIEKLTTKASKETLTPILTAIGEDLSSGIKVDKKHSIVVEGLSDYLYILAFKKLLNFNNDINVIPSTGADTVPYIGSILFGWKLEPIFVLDNDRKGKSIEKRLMIELSIDKTRIILIPQDEDGEIEDMFNKDDRRKYINEGSRDTKSKLLVAIEFQQKVDRDEIKETDLNVKTKDNFKALFDRNAKII